MKRSTAAGQANTSSETHLATLHSYAASNGCGCSSESLACLQGKS